MAFVRVAVLVLLVASGILFALYGFTSQARYRRWGLRILVATLVAAFVFFAVLIAERLA